MPKRTATAPRPETANTPGKKRSRSVKVSAPVAAEPILRAPTHHEISERAYTLYAARGFRAGDAVHDWLQAEEQLRAG